MVKPFIEWPPLAKLMVIAGGFMFAFSIVSIFMFWESGAPTFIHRGFIFLVVAITCWMVCFLDLVIED